MIYVLYSPNCAVCKKVVRFFRNNQIEITKIIIGEDKIERSMLLDILSLCEDGFGTIISFKTESSKRLNITSKTFLDLSTKELLNLIQNDLNLIRRPLIYQTKNNKPYRLQIGYDSEEIEIFKRVVHEGR